ncbi:KpsF/GutQ family sugar-phosphate isomerase [Candidatus Rhabdochlamydia porcellionis]|jgi:arabinose-5-phosphate isomerase|uniref:Arabinose 5-phosphate isomerase KdsD n=1 Tax=Candidatus Rhabdochlamydia porcellionis TaxID=225148 RepID=A0ABX8Z0N9_9BACT|nr:KpsF/GutQ family sugar-phosphate isomerase [Candidatus Rhabdochlamydia porcellionis]QZA59241.1 Arabinose 5-phosphate isomerase KdsD [Candidatus Rhabdochlamydia porcellionis]
MQEIQEILSQQKQYLAHYFANLPLEQLKKVIKQCSKVSGLLVLTGVGKSGIIAEKIAMTLISTGTKALYFPPTNFLHGDIGILSEKDLLLLFSRSGETEELLHLIPFAKKRKTPIIAVISHLGSRLSRLADLSIYLPVEKELCPFNLTPTTSTMVQLLFGDLLTVSLMQKNQFDLIRYSLNHPAGSIGKKATLKVEDLMISDQAIPLADPSDKLIDVLFELSDKKCGAILIVDETKKLLGIFTDGDLRRVLQVRGTSALEQSMRNLMTSSTVVVNRDLLAWNALALMQKDPKRYITILPVVLDDRTVIGILRMHDIVQAGIA